MDDILNLLINGFIKKENLFSNKELLEIEKSVKILFNSRLPVNDSKTAYFWDDKITCPFIGLIKNKVFFLKEYFNNNFILSRVWLRSSYANYQGNGWHQDTNLMIIPNPVIVGIPLQDLNKNNGALKFVPRTHTLPHPNFNKDKILNEILIELNRGGGILFLNSVWHRGCPNYTNVTRDIVYCEFISESSLKANLSIEEYQKSQTSLSKNI